MASTTQFPVASEEDLGGSQQADGSITLATFDELDQRSQKRAAKNAPAAQPPKRKAGDTQALRRAMESDPNADVNFESLEKRQDDLVAIALGENAQTFFGIQSSYIQLGHTALVLVILLAAFAVDPNFPLTNLPVEYRDFLKQGLFAVYAINTLVAGAGFFEARDRGQPVALWVAKCWFLGGVGYNQLVTSTRKPGGGSRGRKPRGRKPVAVEEEKGFSMPELPTFKNPFE